MLGRTTSQTLHTYEDTMVIASKRSNSRDSSYWRLVYWTTVCCWFLLAVTSPEVQAAATGTVKMRPNYLSMDKANARHDLFHLERHRRQPPSAVSSHLESLPMRSKRTTDHLITDCIDTTSDDGQFFHKATIIDGKACGVFLFTEPDQLIELHFNYIDVPCENGGLVSFVDGWELNGEFFPSPQDHPKRLGDRFTEICGAKRKVKQAFVSSQNAALVQYRMPIRGSSFSFSVRFVKNPTPCHTLLQSANDIFTIRNYGRKGNCSVSALFPGVVRVAALNVGVTTTARTGVELETGTLHKCQKRGMEDYVEIGGSFGFDSNHLQLADAVCGLDSKSECESERILCEVTTIRLISSGNFDNSVTLAMREMSEDDITGFVSVNCLPDEEKK